MIKIKLEPSNKEGLFFYKNEYCVVITEEKIILMNLHTKYIEFVFTISFYLLSYVPYLENDNLLLINQDHQVFDFSVREFRLSKFGFFENKKNMNYKCIFYTRQKDQDKITVVYFFHGSTSFVRQVLSKSGCVGKGIKGVLLE